MSNWSQKTQAEKQQLEANKLDVAWFHSRMNALVAELGEVHEPVRSEFIRQCLRNAIEIHASLSKGIVPREVEPGRDF